MRSLQVIFAACFPQETENPLGWWKTQFTSVLLPCPSRFFSPQSMPAAILAISIRLLLSHVTSSIVGPYFGNPWLLHKGTHNSHFSRMPSPSHSSREETPKIVTMTFKLTEIRGRQQPSVQVSIYPNIPVSSSALLC